MRSSGFLLAGLAAAPMARAWSTGNNWNSTRPSQSSQGGNVQTQVQTQIQTQIETVTVTKTVGVNNVVSTACLEPTPIVTTVCMVYTLNGGSAQGTTVGPMGPGNTPIVGGSGNGNGNGNGVTSVHHTQNGVSTVVNIKTSSVQSTRGTPAPPLSSSSAISTRSVRPVSSSSIISTRSIPPVSSSSIISTRSTAAPPPSSSSIVSTHGSPAPPPSSSTIISTHGTPAPPPPSSSVVVSTHGTPAPPPVTSTHGTPAPAPTSAGVSSIAPPPSSRPSPTPSAVNPASPVVPAPQQSASHPAAQQKRSEKMVRVAKARAERGIEN